ncbi:hypothetical protein VBJ03_24290, partial [Enterobacter hormaechei]|nr:hypothetical protein [Enterobacter hormaechei]
MQATATTLNEGAEHVPVNSRNKVVVASLIGTAIEFFDFYIYATAAVIVFPHIFFPQGDPTAATLQSLATFAIAFVTWQAQADRRGGSTEGHGVNGHDV